MISVIRKNQKKLLALFGVLLMIVFVSNMGSQGGLGSGQGNSNYVFGRVNGTKITSPMVAQYNAELEVLRRMPSPLQGVSYPMYQFMKRLDPFTLAMLSAQLPPQYRQLLQQQLNQTYNQAEQLLSRIDGLNFLLLVREAQAMGMQPDAKLMQQEMEQLKMPVDEVSGESGSREERAIYHLQMVLAAFDQVASAAKVTSGDVLARLAVQDQQMTVNMVQYAASEFEDSSTQPSTAPAQPTEREIKQFQAYRSVIAGQGDAQKNPFGFGYRYPNEVKLQYLYLPKEPIERQVTVPALAIARYYRDNRQRFERLPAETQPSTQASSQPASTQPVLQPLSEVQGEIARDLREQFTRRVLEEIRKDVSTKLTEDWNAYYGAVRAKTAAPVSSLGVPFDDVTYLSKLADYIQDLYARRFPEMYNEAFRETWRPQVTWYWQDLVPAVPAIAGRDQQAKFDYRPEMFSLGNQWYSGKELLGLPGIGRSVVRGQRTVFPVYAMTADALLTEAQRKQARAQNVVPLMKYQPSLPLEDMLGDGLYFFRLSDTRTAHDPASIEDVLTQVRADLRKEDGYARAKAKAEQFLAEARQRGLIVASSSWNRPWKLAGPFTAARGGMIPLPDEAQQAFVQKAMSLVNERLKTRNDHPSELIELPQQGLVVVAELASLEPVRSDKVAAQAPVGRAQLAMDGAANLMPRWFMPGDIKERAKYVSEHNETDESETAGL